MNIYTQFICSHVFIMHVCVDIYKDTNHLYYANRCKYCGKLAKGD